MQSLQRPHSAGYHATAFISDRAAFLEWFSTVRHDRLMPWRRRPAEGESFKQMRAKLSRDQLAQWAYEVMISEVMLQQTQVTTVIPYFNRWILKFPTIHALSQGTTEEVHALWTGLGYYSRATRLLSAAQKVMADYSGHLPSSPQILEKDIPGIGPYTAGAISSIAYGVKTPLVDGNVHRVLTRLLGIHSNPTGKPLVSTLWEKAAELVPSDRPGDWNEALMELGARICRPTEAKCGECPLANSCRANAEMNSGIPPPIPEDIEDLCQICVPLPPKIDTNSTNATGLDPTVFPMKAIKKKAREESEDVFIVEYQLEEDESSGLGVSETIEQSSWLVVKRPEKGLLAGLYEFPSFPHSSTDPSPDPTTILSYLFPSLRSSDRPVVKNLVRLDTVFHQFSHISMTYHVSHLILTPPPSQILGAGDKYDRRPQDLMDRAKWVEGKDEVEGLSMATGGKNCWKLLNGGKGKERPKPRIKSGAKKSTADPNSKTKLERAKTSKSITSFFKPKPKHEPEPMGESESIDLVSSNDDLTPPPSSPPPSTNRNKGSLAPLPSIKRKNPSRGDVKSYAEADPDEDGEAEVDAQVKRSRRE
ncbi:A/G-specific adenine DNA glycosylase [Phaffia rhodozyma]|uniref:Adenine DNA glycosylase n=1 Tax=Phaffia rhodozyma TaxID=264483 RepID=A0A0F7SJV6_PHARH|nr:A/G-specific adenine DNA glycosylase [Phaffia rhodozyma]